MPRPGRISWKGGFMQSHDVTINVDLGCGMKKPGSNAAEKWIGVDIRQFDGVDYVLDVGKDRLPFEDDSVNIIRASHLLEHLYSEQLFFCVDECWRVLKPAGEFQISVPKWGTKAWLVHPDHKMHFVEDTFGFFQVPSGGMDPHGYLKGFWHVSVQKSSNPEAIDVVMYPNKPGGRFEYVQIGGTR